MTLISQLSMALTILNPFVDRFNEGGPFFMSLILICFLFSLFFIVKAGLNLKKDETLTKKMIGLTVDSSLLGLVLGFLGSVIGLITAFDSIEAMGNVSNDVLAGGLKVALLSLVFGAFTFCISRIGILIIKALQKS
jgi:hypothetical protein